MKHEHRILTRISNDAPSWKINLEDRANAFTVWVEDPFRMLYCGSCDSLADATSMAHDRSTQTEHNLYIVNARESPPAVIPFRL